jgi:phage terminase large subunit-like protein
VTTPYNVIPIKQSRLSKHVRVDAISGALEAGRVLFPIDEPWLPEFEREVLSFPSVRKDDQVDSLTQYVMWAMERGTARFGYEFLGPSQPTMDSIAHHLLTIRGF